MWGICSLGIKRAFTDIPRLLLMLSDCVLIEKGWMQCHWQQQQESFVSTRIRKDSSRNHSMSVDLVKETSRTDEQTTCSGGNTKSEIRKQRIRVKEFLAGKDIDLKGMEMN